MRVTSVKSSWPRRAYALAGEDGTGAWNHLREASSVAAQSGSIPLRVDVELAHARFFRARHDWRGALWRCPGSAADDGLIRTGHPRRQGCSWSAPKL
ncbi:MAG: hypothetical protein MZV70_13230 [Desulfobacterales bacterium]|nr:hypothetical protein [Desulfobacterales bacterium]